MKPLNGAVRLAFSPEESDDVAVTFENDSVRLCQTVAKNAE